MLSVLLRFRFANVDYDESTQCLRVAGTEVALEPLPRSVLSALLHQNGGTVAKEVLIARFWCDRITVDNVVANAVSKLRRALGSNAATRIVTVSGMGYRLVGPVDRCTAGAVQASVGAPGNRQPERRLSHSAADRRSASASSTFVTWAREAQPSSRTRTAADSALQTVQRHFASGELTPREHVLALARLAQSTHESAMAQWLRLGADVERGWEGLPMPLHFDRSAAPVDGETNRVSPSS